MLDFIYYPVSAILWFWHKVFGAIPFLGPNNGITWALAVVFLVFTLRALLFKPFVSQVRSMRKMQEFAPHIRKLQEKHKGDRQRLAQEMQKLQSEHGVNPLGGCLPILIQIPVFIGLFQVLKEFKPHKQSNYVFSRDEVLSFVNSHLFGAKLSAYITMPQELLTELSTNRVAVAIVAIPLMIAASIATHVTARHSVERQSATAAANPQAAIMNKLMLYIFPIGVLAGGPFFPIAILIYWLSNNLWTLGQQWVVYRKIDQEENEKKEQATVQRQAMAPRPGQKPAVPKNKRPPVGSTSATTDGSPTDGAAHAEGSPADSTAGATNGDAANRGRPTDSVDSPGTDATNTPNATDGKATDGKAANGNAARSKASGAGQNRPRTKKSNRKRR